MSGAAYRSKFSGVRAAQQAAATVAFDRSQLAQDKRKAQALARKAGIAMAGAAAANQGAYMRSIGAPPFLPVGQVQRGFVGAAGEAKYVDVAQATYAFDTTGSVTHMSIIPQGTTVNSRVGRKCELSYFQMRGGVGGSTTTNTATWAAYLVWDEQPNKALAGITDILDAATSYSFPKRENVQRFRILRKWTDVVIGTTATLNAKSSFRIDEYVRLPKGLVVVPTTADTTGVIGDIITGALLLVTTGNVAPGTAAASLNATIRVGFRDN